MQKIIQELEVSLEKIKELDAGAQMALKKDFFETFANETVRKDADLEVITEIIKKVNLKEQ